MIVSNGSGGLGAFLGTRTRDPGSWTDEQILSHVNEYGSPWLGLFEDGQLMSIVLYRQLKDLAEIHYLETHHIYRGRGLMKQLLTEFIARQEGRSIWLDVHEANRAARALYHFFGFRQTGLRKGYYRDGGSCFLLSLEN